MTLAQRTVALVLDEEARAVLQCATVTTPDWPALDVYVQETDDLGLWIRTERGDGMHLLLIRWEYVRSIDVPPGETKSIGLRL